MTIRPQKITFGEMRESGVRDVLIFCRDHRCSHNVEVNADGWADDVRISGTSSRGLSAPTVANAAPRSGGNFPGQDGHRLTPPWGETPAVTAAVRPESLRGGCKRGKMRRRQIYAGELGSFPTSPLAQYEEDKNREQDGQRASAKHCYPKKDLMHETAPVRSGGSNDVSQSPVVAEGDAVMAKPILSRITDTTRNSPEQGLTLTFDSRSMRLTRSAPRR